MAILASW